MRIGTRETVRRIAVALYKRHAFSLVRLCDGEMRAIQSMNKGLMPDGLSQGLGSPDPEKAKAYQLAFLEGLRKADVWGLPYIAGNGVYLQPLLDELGAAGLDVGQTPLGDSCVNVFMFMGGQLWGLLLGRRILVMNSEPEAVAVAMRAEHYSEQALHYGIDRYPPWDIVGRLRTDSLPVPGDEQWPAEPLPAFGRSVGSYVDEAAQYDFDIALVGFGWRAVTFCPALAERTGKVVLDMGHVLREVWLERPQWRDGAFWGGMEVWAAQDGIA